MTYKFPLQRLLELREQREQAIAEQVARANAAADAERLRRDALEATRSSAHSRLTSESQATVGHRMSMNFALTQLGEHVDAAEERTRVAETAAGERQADLIRAAQDRQILDRLRSRRTEEHRVDSASQERRDMDAVAIDRYARPDAAAEREDSTS